MANFFNSLIAMPINHAIKIHMEKLDKIATRANFNKRPNESAI